MGRIIKPTTATTIASAQELYSDASSDMPSGESFDDEDEDEELDASATNEYPENEAEEAEEADEAEDQDNQDNAESRRRQHWLRPAAQVGGQAIWTDLEGWRRNKRDIEDRIVLASRRAALKRRSGAGNERNTGEPDEEFAVEDGDEDAWVHDGIDDIQIDPETRKAASDMSRDNEASIDAEYEPASAAAVVNRTRITTIAEVIPVNADDIGTESGDSIRVNSRLLPAAYLSLDEAQRLLEANKRRYQDQNQDQ